MYMNGKCHIITNNNCRPITPTKTPMEINDKDPMYDHKANKTILLPNKNKANENQQDKKKPKAYKTKQKKGKRTVSAQHNTLPQRPAEPNKPQIH